MSDGVSGFCAARRLFVGRDEASGSPGAHKFDFASNYFLLLEASAVSSGGLSAMFQGILTLRMVDAETGGTLSDELGARLGVRAKRRRLLRAKGGGEDRAAVHVAPSGLTAFKPGELCVASAGLRAVEAIAGL